jgi:2,5-dihydroxypyridine 5,6-dioxygenase
MPVSDVELVQMFEHVLKLSKVDETQSVAVLSSTYSNPRLVSAAMDASQRLKAKAYRVDLPPVNQEKAVGNDLTGYLGVSPLTGHTAAKKALEAADLVVDTMLLLHSPEQDEILRSGTRMLLVVEPPEILARMIPTEEDKRRVLAGVERLKKAKTMSVKSKAGTDLVCPIGDYPILTEYGFSEEPGRWDHWPSGFLATWPNERKAEGTIIIDTGDIILPFKNYVQSPITLEVHDGTVQKIHGKLDAELLESYMKSFRDPDVFAISHIGWGLQPRAQWAALNLYDKHETVGMDCRAFYGNFLFSTGPNTEAGGSRNTPCHMDIPLRNCSVYLDGEPMVIEGDVIPKDQAVRI